MLCCVWPGGASSSSFGAGAALRFTFDGICLTYFANLQHACMNFQLGVTTVRAVLTLDVHRKLGVLGKSSDKLSVRSQLAYGSL